MDPLISEVGDRGESLFEKDPAAPGAMAFEKISEACLQNLNLDQLEAIEVNQVDPQTLHIQFSHDNAATLSAPEIQKNCPCARCTGDPQSKKLDPKVSILEFSFIGRYAIKLVYSSGCSQGIYPFSLLKTL